MTKEELEDIAGGTGLKVVKVRSPLNAIASSDTCINAAEWLREEDEPDTPLVDRLIERGEMVAVVGQSKAGKSFIALQMAVCIALGLPFLGRETVRQKVYIANLEVSRKQYKKRLRRIVARLNVSLDDLDGWLFVDNMKGETATWKSCLTKAEDNDCTVCLIDPFYQIFKGDETSVEDCQRAIDHMKIFQRRGMTLIVVFHSPKGFSGDRQLIDMISGSSMLARFPESIIGLLNHAKDKDCRVVKCILRNYAPPEDVTIRYDGGVFVIDADIEAVVESAENRVSARTRKPSAEDDSAALARSVAYWAKEIHDNMTGYSVDDIKSEIVRVAGVSKTRANIIVYEIKKSADTFGLNWDKINGTFGWL